MFRRSAFYLEKPRTCFIAAMVTFFIARCPYFFCTKHADNLERKASRLETSQAYSLLCVYPKSRPTQEPQVALC